MLAEAAVSGYVSPMFGWLRQRCGFCANTLTRALLVGWRALTKYVDTDGEQRAASFAYYAFFALFPMILLLISIGSIFVDKVQVSAAVIAFFERYIPTLADEPKQSVIIQTINGVVTSWKSAGVIAIAAILWSALGLFHALVRGVNRAWGTLEYPWWRLPFKNMFMVGIVGSALLIGVVAPVLLEALEKYTWQQPIHYGVEMLVVLFWIARRLIPSAVLFYGFTMFYKFAPRRHTLFSEVWLASLLVTVALQFLQSGFVFYARHSPSFNRVYGTLGGVVALLMWIYLSGSVIILGGCLCAAAAELRERKEGDPDDQPPPVAKAVE